jgi:isopentenyl diphosphate isomerase/L-lactate dehydrogenase-like FMN-dependent dehydrogenase
MKDFVALLFGQLVDSLRSLAKPKQRKQARLDALKTIDEVRDAARGALPKVIFEFVDGGAGDEVTMRRNIEAFDRWTLDPRFLVDVGEVDMSANVLGSRIQTPILGAPAGLLGLINRDGEAAMSAAIAGTGQSIYCLAAMSSFTLEEVRAAAPNGRLWFQTYLWRDRDIIASLVDRAEAANYEALVVTVDVPRSADRKRDRVNKFGLPPRITARTLYEGVTHPRWTRDFLLHPRITAGNVADRAEGGSAVSVAGYVDRQFDPTATWSDLAWLRERWNGPMVVKGILSADDARRAADLGVQGIAVSNHGGRQLDHAPASLEVLPEIVAEVGGSCEVYLDGGVRRGSDVIKAVALGATAVMAGRPFVMGLGAAGQAGVEAAHRVLNDELRAAMMLAGIQTLDTAGPHVLRPSFSR